MSLSEYGNPDRTLRQIFNWYAALILLKSIWRSLPSPGNQIIPFSKGQAPLLVLVPCLGKPMWQEGAGQTRREGRQAQRDLASLPPCPAWISLGRDLGTARDSAEYGLWSSQERGCVQGWVSGPARRGHTMHVSQFGLGRDLGTRLSASRGRVQWLCGNLRPDSESVEQPEGWAEPTWPVRGSG